MFRLTRFQLTLTLVALLLLRLTIGYHFFKEGVAKVKSGNFSAEGFLSSAKGPLAPLYLRMIEDNDHARLLCYDKDKKEVDPKLTIFIWEDYKNDVASAYRFGDPAKVDKLKEQRSADRLKIEKLRKQIAALDRPAAEDDSDSKLDNDQAEDKLDDDVTGNGKSRRYLITIQSDEKSEAAAEDKDNASNSDEKSTDPEDTKDDKKDPDSDDAEESERKPAKSDRETLQKELDELIVRYEKAEDDIKKIRAQVNQANEIFNRYADSLKLYLSQNKSEIETYFKAMHRLEGFRKDGDSREEVAQEVPTLNGQLNQIKSTMAGDAAPWISTIRTTWDQYESEISELALEEDREKMKRIRLTRSHDRPLLSFVDKVIPWFDLTVGVLLFIGLFTRLAAVAAACFLASVISTQLPWVPNAQPTYYQFVELAGLLVLAATAAGRIAGLDFFINALFWSSDPADEE